MRFPRAVALLALAAMCLNRAGRSAVLDLEEESQAPRVKSRSSRPAAEQAAARAEEKAEKAEEKAALAEEKADQAVKRAEKAEETAAAADEDADSGAEASPRPLPSWLAAGDVPTAYALRKYELRTDFGFYGGGGLMGKAYLGLFKRFVLGGAADLRNFIGSGEMHMFREDAQLLARFALILEDQTLPGLAVGWDGPTYPQGEAKGLYLAASKKFPTRLATYALHAGLNSAKVETFDGSRDLRASLALTSTYHNVGLFTGLDECFYPGGPRWCAGASFFADPITLSLELRDIGTVRAGVATSRMLRVSWVGRF